MATVAVPNPIFARLHDNRGMIFPLALVTLLLVILVPLPTQVLDLLLILNITLSVVVMVTVIYVKSPLEFAVFPSLLLAITLFRLVLNVATTRLVLTNLGGTHAAGEVVQTFADFVTRGSLAVGIIIFLIIVVIQFVVITKGATRISEVAARFTLDAMPGKQMAIDADMNAGHITEAQARQRRDEISQEADFYGAMDGASKFVRGDAIAAIVITFVNILGGIYVGMVEHHMDILECLQVYTKLTIGDGLVSQVPAFIVSLAAGLIVTRTSSRKDLGEEMLGQLFAKPKALIVAASFLALMSVTGLPKAPMLVLGSCCGGIAWMLTRNEKKVLAAQAAVERDKVDRKEPEKVEKLLDLDAMELEVGYGLVRLVDTAKGGDLLDRISMIRRQVAMDLGIIVPPIRIRDNMQLGANDYIVKIKGQAIGRGVTYPEQFLAMDNGATSGPIPGGTLTTEPAFGLPAYWITEPQRPQAELMNYTVVEATAVLATHLTEIVKTHAHELLTRQEVKNLIENLKTRVPALIEDVIPTQIKPGELQKVMQNLLRDRVPVRDLETIVETLGDFSARTKDLDVLTEYVRNALGRTICKQYVDERDRLWVLTLDPALEELVNSHIDRERGNANTMPPQLAQQVVQKIAEKTTELTQTGRNAVILCGPQIRAALRRMIESSLPQMAVLAFNEIAPEVTVEAVGLVGMNGQWVFDDGRGRLQRPCGIMHARTFKASTMAEALAQVKREMGGSAVILHTRTYFYRYCMGLRRREIVEITAGRDLNVSPRRQAIGAARPIATSRAQIAYAGTSVQPARHLLETPVANSAAMLGLTQEMTSLKTMVKDLVSHVRHQKSPEVPEELFDHYLHLIENQVAEELAVDVVKNIQRQCRPENLRQPEYVQERLSEQLEKLIPVSGAITRTKTVGPHVVALIGPTGVGKTTTIAKLAANLKLCEKRRVGLITIDTYRIAAIDQLRKYAEIIGSPLRIVGSPEDLKDAVAAMSDCDYVLIDTAGRSPNDALKLSELKNFLSAAAPDEVHLVLSTTASQECVELAIERFSEVRVDKIIFTKLDEATHVGVVLNVVRKVNKALSYVTTGQDVPDDIEVGKARRLAQLIIQGGGVNRALPVN